MSYKFHLDILIKIIITSNRDVAQPGSALHWGCSGRRSNPAIPTKINKKTLKIVDKHKKD